MVNVVPPTKAELESVAAKRIVFAHQSVGNDILGGVRALAAREGVALNIEEVRSAAPESRGLLHFKVGQNEQPEGKISDYVATLGDGAFGEADVAMLKLCYIDFRTSTDGRQLATEYANAMDSLQGRFPQTRFVAMTAPLTTVQAGPKAWLKRLMGKTPAGFEINAVRKQFNDELRKRYEGSRLFDIARFEAHGGETPQVFDYGGSSIEALDPALTYDGGHLNERGQLTLGAALVRFLAATP